MEDKVYYPEVIETYALPYTTVEEESPSTNYEGKNVISPSNNVNKMFPEKRIARETIGMALDTQKKRILGEFTFGQVGSIAIGTYENGVSGDIRITPNGLVARDINGVETISLDGATGSAVFRGTIQAGAVIAGAVVVGDSTITLDGVNKRIVINDGTDNRIVIGSV